VAVTTVWLWPRTPSTAASQPVGVTDAIRSTTTAPETSVTTEAPIATVPGVTTTAPEGTSTTAQTPTTPSATAADPSTTASPSTTTTTTTTTGPTTTTTTGPILPPVDGLPRVGDRFYTTPLVGERHSLKNNPTYEETRLLYLEVKQVVFDADAVTITFEMCPNDDYVTTPYHCYPAYQLVDGDPETEDKCVSNGIGFQKAGVPFDVRYILPYGCWGKAPEFDWMPVSGLMFNKKGTHLQYLTLK